jgi:hypothetical protein
VSQSRWQPGHINKDSSPCVKKDPGSEIDQIRDFG